MVRMRWRLRERQTSGAVAGGTMRAVLWRALAASAAIALVIAAGSNVPAPHIASLDPHTRTTNVNAYSRQVDRIEAVLELWRAARDDLEGAVELAEAVAEVAGTQWAQAELATLREVVAEGSVLCGDYRAMHAAAARIREQTQVVSAQIETEQAAAAAEARAEAEARAQAEAEAESGSGTWNSAEAYGTYSLYVGNAAGPGEQAKIDACDGATDITAWYGTPSIAQHWGCGGSRFPTTPGATVRLTGQRSGLFEVIGVVKYLDAAVDDISDVPLGYDLLFQTCIGGSSAQMSLVALRRIG